MLKGLICLEKLLTPERGACHSLPVSHGRVLPQHGADGGKLVGNALVHLPLADGHLGVEVGESLGVVEGEDFGLVGEEGHVGFL